MSALATIDDERVSFDEFEIGELNSNRDGIYIASVL